MSCFICGEGVPTGAPARPEQIFYGDSESGDVYFWNGTEHVLIVTGEIKAYDNHEDAKADGIEFGRMFRLTADNPGLGTEGAIIFQTLT